MPPKPPKRTRNLSGHSSGAVGGEEEVAGRAADELKRRAGEEVEGVGEEAAGRAQAPVQALKVMLLRHGVAGFPARVGVLVAAAAAAKAEAEAEAVV